MDKLSFKILPVSKITDLDTQRMFELFQDCYVDVTFAQFQNDLREKSHVMLLFSPSKPSRNLIGFSTILKAPLIVNGKNLTCLFSGDTVVKKEYWGTKVLQRAFFKYILLTKIQSLFSPVYWMLMSKGHKTYLLMRKNFFVSYPQSSERTPAEFKAVKDTFYSARFGDAYKAEESLIEFPVSHGAVKPEIACPSADQYEDSDVQFFLAKNPNYARGVELACIAKIRIVDLISTMIKHVLGIRKKTNPPMKTAKKFEEAV